jgi:hypothetical protein
MERNIKNIHKEGELDAEATIRNFLIVQTERQRNRKVEQLNERKKEEAWNTCCIY